MDSKYQSWKDSKVNSDFSANKDRLEQEQFLTGGKKHIKMFKNKLRKLIKLKKKEVFPKQRAIGQVT